MKAWEETTTVNITQLQYENIQFYVQHAAAAYCNFNAAPGSIITCRENACPLVQQNKATVVTSFMYMSSSVRISSPF